MKIIFVNGKSEPATANDILRMFQHPWSVAFVVLALLLFATIKPHAAVVPDIPFHQMTILWANSVVGYYALYLVAAWWAQRTGRNLWSIVALGVISLYQTLGGAALVVALGHPAVPLNDILQLFVFHIVLLSLLETIFTAFILRKAKADNAAALAGAGTPVPPPETPPNAQTVVLLGQVFVTDELEAISAQEHFVQITTRTGQHQLRGRLSDIEAQLPDSIGFRVHRSHWVAARAVKGLQRGPSWAVTLHDGKTLPVARPRREAVEGWLATAGVPQN